MTKTAGRVRKWLDLYHHHLNDVLGLAPATRRKYLFVVPCLMGELCPDGKLVSSRFTADAIAGFVNRDAAPRLKTKENALSKLAPAGGDVHRFRADDKVLAFLASL